MCEVRSLHIAFYRARYGSAWDRLVACYTRGPYSHCELLFPAGIMYSAIRRRGLRFAFMEHPEQYRLVELPDANLSAARLWCELHAGEKYSVAEMLACTLPLADRVIQRSALWYCSMLCAHVFNRFGGAVAEVDERVSPNELCRWLHTTPWTDGCG